MGDIINALRLWAEKGRGVSAYTREELELLEKTGIFYGTSSFRPKVSKLSKYRDEVDLIIEIKKHIGLDVKIIPKTEHTAIVSVKGDSDILKPIDLFWLAELDLYPVEELRILKWFSNNYKIPLPERSKLYKTFDSVAIHTDENVTYLLRKDETILVEKPIIIRNAKFVISTPIDKESVTVSLAKDLIEKVVSNIKIINSKENTITYYKDRVDIRFMIEVNNRRFIYHLNYNIVNGNTSLAISRPLYNYDFSRIHYLLRNTYPELDKDFIPSSTVVSVENIDLSRAITISRSALTILKHITLVKENDVDYSNIPELVNKIEELLEKKCFPILRSMATLDVALLYLEAMTRDNEKLKTFIKRAYADVPENIVKLLPSIEEALPKRLSNPIKAREIIESLRPSKETETEILST